MTNLFSPSIQVHPDWDCGQERQPAVLRQELVRGRGGRER